MKSLLVFVALVGSSLLFYGCPLCPDVTAPFYRVQSFSVWINGDLQIEESDTLSYQLFIDSVEYLARAKTQHSLGGDAAMATSCSSDGDRGLKSPIDSVVFTTLADWNPEHMNGSKINGLIEKGAWNWQTDQYEWTPIEGQEWNENTFGDNYRILSKPVNPGEYSFSVAVYTADGLVVEEISPVFIIE